MPASSRPLYLLLFVILATSTATLPGSSHPGREDAQTSFLPVQPGGLSSALNWLAGNESSFGSYGAYREHWTASAAYALWLNDTGSAEAALSYSYLATQLDNSSSWFWGSYGEADVPGAVLYSVASSTNLGLINETAVAGGVLQFQQSSGGFKGYYDSSQGQTVTSSVDTDMALLGLDTANIIPTQNTTLAVNYLLSLQNPDGSYNLTSTIRSDSLYSLGPDPVSITALTLLALKSAGLTLTDAPISSGLGFLSEKTLASLCSGGRTYSMALATIAFKAYGQQDDAVRSSTYLVSQQNADGGFSDATRSYYPESNALDTGWAAIALETQPLISGATPQIKNCLPVADFSFSPETPTTKVSVRFDATSSSGHYGDQLAYKWTFGDGHNATGPSPSHAYNVAGNYTVTLTVIDSGTNPGPLSDTKSAIITVEPTSVQGSSTLPPNNSGLFLAIGAIAFVAVIAAGLYVGRRSRLRLYHS